MSEIKQYRCLSCGAEYYGNNEDGTAYYHACPVGVKSPRDENIDQKTKKAKKEGKGKVEIS